MGLASRFAPLSLALVLGVVLAGCQASGPSTSTAAGGTGGAAPSSAVMAFAASNASANFCAGPPRQWAGGLAGRTIAVRSRADLKLGPREVVLTFDDGPRPTFTRAVMRTLDQHSVKATFFLVGQMAARYPGTVREIAAGGHTIAHHTYSHPDLTKLSTKAALAEIAKGERAIANALSGSGRGHAPFFRFPYLAETRALHRALAARGTIAIGVDVDSKDYYRTTPDVLLARTLKRLRRRGRGILLFHDIHPRTVAMLPRLLRRLDAEGYKVVHLVPGERSSACRIETT